MLDPTSRLEEAHDAASKTGVEFDLTAYPMEEKLRAIQLHESRLPPKWAAAMAVPFLDESPMIGPAPWSAKHFQEPRLRRCTMDPSTLSWEAKLDGGLDGYVWKVWFGDAGPFALKLVSTSTHLQTAHRANIRLAVLG